MCIVAVRQGEVVRALMKTLGTGEGVNGTRKMREVVDAVWGQSIARTRARTHKIHKARTKHTHNLHTYFRCSNTVMIIVTDIMFALSSLSNFPLNTFLTPSHLRHGRLWRHRRIRVPRCRRPSRRHHSQPGVACEHGASAADSAHQGSAKGESKAWELTVLGLSPEGQWSRSDKVAGFAGAGYSRA